jgi:hypothetical protein
MPFSFSGETWNHRTHKPNAQPRTRARLGRFLSALLSPLEGLFLFEQSETRRSK